MTGRGEAWEEDDEGPEEDLPRRPETQVRLDEGGLRHAPRGTAGGDDRDDAREGLLGGRRGGRRGGGGPGAEGLLPQDAGLMALLPRRRPLTARHAWRAA